MLNPIDDHRAPSIARPTTWIASGLAFLTGIASGYGAWRFLRYWQSLLGQPRLILTPHPAQMVSGPALIPRAMEIASDNLRAGVEPRLLPDGPEMLVVCAGHRNFREPWARDLSFASLGLVELQERRAVKEALEVFLINQRLTGQFPVQVRSTSVLDRYLHSLLGREQPITAPIRPKYVTAHNTIALDGNALVVMAVLNYANRLDDPEFLHVHWDGLVRALRWLEGYTWGEDGLLYQQAFADWADSIARKGEVLYTNVAYWKALVDMAAAAARQGYSEDAADFADRAAHLAAAINAHFWREDLGYYVTSQDFDNLSSGGNLMAIAWGLATPQQAHTILDTMARFGMADPVPTRPVYPPYHNRYIALENRLGRIGYYHTDAAWLWIGAWHVIALSRVGRLDEAEALLRRIARVIVRDGMVYEVYRPDGHHVSGLWYRAEGPFSWSAGMVVHAYHVLQRQQAAAQPQAVRQA